MLKIGLIIADENEIHDVDEFKFVKAHDNGCFIINEYSLFDLNVFVIHSRIGLVNGAIACQYLITTFEVNQIWNYGAVGSCGKYKLFDIAFPTKYFYFDAKTPWYPRGQIPQEDKYFTSEKINENTCSIASGNSFIFKKEDVEEIKKEIDIDLIDMEACAIAQTCNKNKIPFYCIKGISDVIGNENIDRTNINENISKASKLALNKMIEIIKELNY